MLRKSRTTAVDPYGRPALGTSPTQPPPETGGLRLGNWRGATYQVCPPSGPGHALPRFLAARMIWVTSLGLTPSLPAISAGRSPCSLYRSASRSCDLVQGERAGAGAGRGRGRSRRAGWREDAAPPGSGADGPNEPRRWSRYLPLASCSRAWSSRMRNSSAALFMPMATMVRPLAFISWHFGAMQ
jgi:hypothetical protein